MRQVFATVPIWREYAHGIDRKLSKAENPNPAILSGGFPGADIAGQEHLEYPPDIYLSLMSGAMLVIKLFFRKWSHLVYRPFVIYFEKIKEKAQALPEEATGALEPQQAESTDGFGTNTITLALISCSMTANSHNRITEV